MDYYQREEEDNVNVNLIKTLKSFRRQNFHDSNFRKEIFLRPTTSIA